MLSVKYLQLGRDDSDIDIRLFIAPACRGQGCARWLGITTVVYENEDEK